MAKITIELEQAKTQASRQEGRKFKFQDGIDRIITLPRRNWVMYDRLCERWVYPGLYEDEVFDIAGDFGEPGEEAFESMLSYLFGLAIEAGWSLYNKDELGSSNENMAGSYSKNNQG